ncbi:MAG: hypothetical protein M1823_000476 [Watsoniomyces obsoletus]|nr:MAG: hypothetical protein M1823_000476 [Watsoniomyces obsoletus]
MSNSNHAVYPLDNRSMLYRGPTQGEPTSHAEESSAGSAHHGMPAHGALSTTTDDHVYMIEYHRSLIAQAKTESYSMARWGQQGRGTGPWDAYGRESLGSNTAGRHPHGGAQQTIVGPTTGNGTTPTGDRRPYGVAQQGEAVRADAYRPGGYLPAAQHGETSGGQANVGSNTRPRRRRARNHQAAATEQSHALSTWVEQDAQQDPFSGFGAAEDDPNAAVEPVEQHPWDGGPIEQPGSSRGPTGIEGVGYIVGQGAAGHQAAEPETPPEETVSYR